MDKSINGKELETSQENDKIRVLILLLFFVTEGIEYYSRREKRFECLSLGDMS